MSFSKVEALARGELESLQFDRLGFTLEQAFKTPFYRGRLKEAGIGEDFRPGSWEEFQRLPFTVKDDLRAAYPVGLLAEPHEKIVRLHASSGTTGIPTVIYHTKDDLSSWAGLVRRSLCAAGAGESDVFQNMMTYGLFTGGFGLHYGAEELGMLVIPTGAGNTMRQFRMMRDFKTTIVHATPSYLLHIHEKMREEGIGREELFLRKAIVGGEPHSEDTRRKIEELLKIDVYNCYGLSELNGPGVAFECVHKAGMHLWEDAYIMEIIDPDTLLPLPDGETGELVCTTLQRNATPLIRYRTRDLTRIIAEPCACGRTHRRIARIMGRSDDMLIINGVNVFPSQIEEVLMRSRGIGSNYQIIVEKAGALDKLTVKTEIASSAFSDDTRSMNALTRYIKEALKASISINPAVELHEPGILPVWEGKATRVIDTR
ncbi:MAG: phenylacetate--CoA ligase [Spirochaetales bacterium]|jgi:phenylacetate-CoA ligase|nr:phenylacetate--CoA ligase [Spirochaetales bacterium]